MRADLKVRTSEFFGCEMHLTVQRHHLKWGSTLVSDLVGPSTRMSYSDCGGCDD